MQTSSKDADRGRRVTDADPSADYEAEAQSLSDLDQTNADADQTGSDLDQTGSDRDQLASDRDQQASDRDQEASDRDQETRDGDETAYEDDYASTRRSRAWNTLQRDANAQLRSDTARVRDHAASERDTVAEARDSLARGRDRLTALLDAQLAQLEHVEVSRDGGPSTPQQTTLRVAAYRKRAEAARARAAREREAAARDRQAAARDRRLAAIDRAKAAEELALEGVDHLTGALRRRVGMAAMQREMDRTFRSGEPLVVAFVDVDGLKAVNDSRGHAAGDKLLRGTVEAIKCQLRSYDVVTRFGGDEFVCALSGQDAAGARNRFSQISVRLREEESHASITVGFAERRKDDSLADLVNRADRALRQTRDGRVRQASRRRR